MVDDYLQFYVNLRIDWGDNNFGRYSWQHSSRKIEMVIGFRSKSQDFKTVI